MTIHTIALPLRFEDEQLSLEILAWAYIEIEDDEDGYSVLGSRVADPEDQPIPLVISERKARQMVDAHIESERRKYA